MPKMYILCVWLGLLYACHPPQHTTNTTNAPYGTLVDSRDGQQYLTIKLAGQEWMAQNLAYKSPNSYCYQDKNKFCTTFGRLYTWDAAMEACPDGWRLPSDKEWKKLAEDAGGFYDRETTQAVGNPREGYKELISGGKSGFNALFGGYRNEDGDYFNHNEIGFYWTSTEERIHGAWNYSFVTSTTLLSRFSYDFGEAKKKAYSCRCIKQ